ncbi:Uncharacterized protein HZ326_13755 [Fusarium oxysporum f. sp. albedinis]|nr:Uncharacterized protein HZ326_13755 [Fusarium oxysporum f. sp. albedinis]
MTSVFCPTPICCLSGSFVQQSDLSAFPHVRIFSVSPRPDNPFASEPPSFFTECASCGLSRTKRRDHRQLHGRLLITFEECKRNPRARPKPTLLPYPYSIVLGEREVCLCRRPIAAMRGFREAERE